LNIIYFSIICSFKYFSTFIIIYLGLEIIGAITGGGGTATVALLMVMYIFGFEIIRGYATNTIPELFAVVTPTVIYAFYGFINIKIAIILFITNFIGGFIGVKIALKKGNDWVKILFTIVVIILVIKTLFF